ncbi:tRNA-dihydrouridine synthase [Nonomuraea muscovyensis]|uniref:tRNA-dihydrouridine synthase n=1 Tax=Nonomuraea muscovyensis TaxID=1124761 RepID=A0A7X0EW00_9ACTN|nr:hypothetical protein [Nonomuraea muscovyensis]MBB6343774.1 tRNA-dihydrouridine synthase [Nonomuraea muscovyensis]
MAAWARLVEAVNALDDQGLAAVHGMAKWARANLPADVACLVEVLDAAKDLSVAVVADRKGLTVAEIEAVIAEATGGGVHG